MVCQYLINEYSCKLKGEGGICWKAKGNTPDRHIKEEDCWVPRNKGVLKVL